jgi:MoaA/NifB/PqqE/SkfB family radical SAM enzyme
MKPPIFYGSKISDSEKKEALINKKALTLVLFFGYGCELACPMCYAGINSEVKKLLRSTDKMLNFDEYRNILIAAKKQGIKYVGISGEGDPLINIDKFFKLVTLINEQELIPIVETNGVKIDKNVAEQLYKKGVSVIGKCHSFNPSINNYLVGKNDVYQYEKIDNISVPSHIKHLIDVGMTVENRLGINTVITTKNNDEVENIWEWERKNNIIPFMEFIVHLGYAKENTFLDIPEKMRMEIHNKIYALDKKLGYSYDFSLGLYPGDRTCDNRTIIMIDMFGNSKLCACSYLSIGNIREDSFDDLIKKHYQVEEDLGRKYLNDSVYCECERYNQSQLLKG